MQSHSSADTTPASKGVVLEDFLEEKLQEALAYRSPPLGLSDIRNIDPQTFSIRASTVIHKMSSGLEDLITSDSRFLGRTVKIIRTLNGGFGFYPKFVGPKLLQRTIDTGSASGGISWLQKVLSTQVADGKFITALWNVPVGSEVQLTPDVRLIPFESLPHSRQKAAIENSQFQTGIISSPLIWEPPSSALVVPYQVAPFLRDPEESHAVDGEFSGFHESVAEITMLLTLIGPRVAIQVAHWFNFDDPDLELALLGQSRGSQIMEILPKLIGQDPPALNSQEAIEIIRRFKTLTPSAKEKIKIATDRLKRALLRHQAADRAVEVSIALEILCGDNQTSEMTHKVKVRAVRLLGGDSGVRERNRTILTKTYDVRSKLVHQGSHDTKPISVLGVSMGVDAVISEACHLCAELIKTVIRRGAFPDWLHFDINDHQSMLVDARGE
ncbi:hypothetical protein DFR40_1821 [Azonexus fungiphilus]|uniref:Uncharacterized protein n=1 Tax=Azonexus fungiphilus TaxID=146940 RepID=A0A495WDC0_9RHOO|nr:HEPN domain-containing protein [Azonexus fungiphilus]RKT58793.1 hypothetical protein DFR40_1821 [Azonexus fungiphilus]